MAVIEKCDGCGSISPSEDGLYLSNNWIEVKVEPRRKRNIYTETKREFLLCEDCFGVKDLEPCLPWVGKLINSVKRKFKIMKWNE